MSDLPLGTYSKDIEGKLVILGDHVLVDRTRFLGKGVIIKISPQGKCMTVRGRCKTVKRVYPNQITWLEKWSPLERRGGDV